jgi:hypothetical protein
MLAAATLAEITLIRPSFENRNPGVFAGQSTLVAGLNVRTSVLAEGSSWLPMTVGTAIREEGKAEALTYNERGRALGAAINGMYSGQVLVRLLFPFLRFHPLPPGR